MRMRQKLNYKDNVLEPFALKTIASFYDSIYNDFIWNKKADNFDFIHSGLGIALEISTIITKNTQKVVAYEHSVRPDIRSIKQAKTDINGNLISWYGGSGFEIKNLILERIECKNAKAQKHFISNFKECQLCLCVDDGGWFESVEEFDFLKESPLVKNMIFSKIFIITRDLFLVYENNQIASYQRKSI